MKVKVNLLRTNGSTKEVEVKSFKEIQDLVGGYVQLFKNPTNDSWLLLNEDGQSLNLPKNEHFKQYNFVGDIVCFQSYEDLEVLNLLPYE